MVRESPLDRIIRQFDLKKSMKFRLIEEGLSGSFALGDQSRLVPSKVTVGIS